MTQPWSDWQPLAVARDHPGDRARRIDRRRGAGRSGERREQRDRAHPRTERRAGRGVGVRLLDPGDPDLARRRARRRSSAVRRAGARLRDPAGAEVARAVTASAPLESRGGSRDAAALDGVPLRGPDGARRRRGRGSAQSGLLMREQRGHPTTAATRRRTARPDAGKDTGHRPDDRQRGDRAAARTAISRASPALAGGDHRRVHVDREGQLGDHLGRRL